ncbi:hypothetical protein MCG98_07715 [Ruminococcus sp. OA3]|uniref:hypothetical protein n=1 Tax=Ruminococcus sp. OA3 TaxID=2914164 RepID=UPI001F068FBD|nr:hypothetical protein [Ruminococcus sp. OA3]MCH1982450.1 hypothetical protein [Ruminococcus sp. OA3]
MDQEYLMLRDELLHLDSVVNNTINFFYVFIASFIAFALTQEDTIFILLSYIVIIPAYLIVISKMQGICKIGAYLSVFHEGGKFNWESRNIKFSQRHVNIFSYIVSSNFPFIFVSAAVVILFLYRTQWDTFSLVYEKCKLCSGFLLFLVVLVLAYKNRNITTKDYIKKWEDI